MCPDQAAGPGGTEARPPESSEPLLRAVYCSTATRDLHDEDLVALLEVSRRNNLAWNITGALAYHDRAFIQVLEGPEAAVEALLARIARDDRNTKMMIFDRSMTKRRSFDGWSMGWVGAKDLARAGFDPALLFLRDTPDLLVNAMLAAFRKAVRLDLRD